LKEKKKKKTGIRQKFSLKAMKEAITDKNTVLTRRSRFTAVKKTTLKYEARRFGELVTED